MKIKRKDLITIWAVLETIKDSKTNIRTTYTIAKNRNLIEPEVVAIQEAMKLFGPLAEYENKRVSLCKEYCKKNDNGDPITDNGSYVFDSDQRVEFEKKLKELQESMPEAIEQAKKQEIEIENLMEDVVDIELLTFKISSLPDNLMSVAQLEVLDKCNLITAD